MPITIALPRHGVQGLGVIYWVSFPFPFGTAWAGIVTFEGRYIGLSPGPQLDWRAVYRDGETERRLVRALENGVANILECQRLRPVG
jgi:hypothetical protein